MSSEKRSFVVDRSAAVERLGLIETRQIGTHRLRLVLPVNYRTATRQQYPLVLMLDGSEFFGSAAEMSRLMTETGEIQPCIVACLETPLAQDFGSAEAEVAEVLRKIAQEFRIADGKIALFGAGADGARVVHAALTRATGADQFIIGNPDATLSDGVIRKMRASYQRNGGVGRRVVLTSAGADRADAVRSLAANLELIAGSDLAVYTRHLESMAPSAAAVPALVHGLRTLLATGNHYGSNVEPLRKPLAVSLMKLFGPLLGKQLIKKAGAPVTDDGSHLFRSQGMNREFEVFVSMPASAGRASGQRYPALFVLDANIEFATVAEIAVAMAAAGEIEECIVVGLGIPRAEGPLEFAFRRFEEFAPPLESYDFSDDLGRVFRSLFYARGQDARQRMGLAPALHRFISDELIPRLAREYPIDRSNLGLLGHSAGGAFAAYALHQKDSQFQRYACVSPGLAMSGHWLMQRESAVASSTAGVFLCIGSEERGNLFNQMAGIPETEAYARQLQRSYVPARYACIAGETHSSLYPQAVAAALTELYAATEGQQRRIA